MPDSSWVSGQEYRGGDVAHNITKLGSLDLIGGGQVVVQGNYAFVGHMKPTDGTTIINVTDPKNPKIIWQGQTNGNKSHTHKVRVSGDIMVTNVEQNNRHVLRAGSRIPGIRAALEEARKAASDEAVAAEIGCKVEQLPEMIAAQEPGFYEDGGFKTWDISDLTKPKELAHVRTHGFGTLRSCRSHQADRGSSLAYAGAAFGWWRNTHLDAL